MDTLLECGSLMIGISGGFSDVTPVNSPSSFCLIGGRYVEGNKSDTVVDSSGLTLNPPKFRGRDVMALSASSADAPKLRPLYGGMGVVEDERFFVVR